MNSRYSSLLAKFLSTVSNFHHVKGNAVSVLVTHTFRGCTETHGCSFIWSICSQTLESSDQTPLRSCNSSKATCDQGQQSSYTSEEEPSRTLLGPLGQPGWGGGEVGTRCLHPPASGSGSYLDALFAAAEKPCVGQLQGLFGLRALLAVILQSAELPFVYGESLKCLLWTQVALKRSRPPSQSQVSGQRGPALRRWRGLCTSLSVCV